MSDARLRELERRWRASGELDDEVAHLREALRLGQLERGRLELAAWCEHEASSLVLGDPASRASSGARPWTTTGPDDVRLPALARWGREALVRGALAAAREALSRGDDLIPVQEGGRAILAAVDAWTRAPGQEAAAEAHARAAAFMRGYESTRGPGPILWVVPAVLAALSISDPDLAGRCESTAVDALAHARSCTRDEAAVLAWAAVGREVVPWALRRSP